MMDYQAMDGAVQEAWPEEEVIRSGCTGQLRLWKMGFKLHVHKLSAISHSAGPSLPLCHFRCPELHLYPFNPSELTFDGAHLLRESRDALVDLPLGQRGHFVRIAE